MALPMATTTISTTRSANNGSTDLYDTPATPAAVLSGVRAVITGPSSRTSFSAGQRVVTTAAFRADPCDVKTGDVMTDDTSGTVYQVLWALDRYELGLAYTYGALQIVKGATA